MSRSEATAAPVLPAGQAWRGVRRELGRLCNQRRQGLLPLARHIAGSPRVEACCHRRDGLLARLDRKPCRS